MHSKPIPAPPPDDVLTAAAGHLAGVFTAPRFTADECARQGHSLEDHIDPGEVGPEADR